MIFPSKSENPDGLHQKYVVSKVNGKPIDPRAEFFVLRLDPYCKDSIHRAACKLAVQAYADAIEAHIPQLAYDLRQRYGLKKTV